MLDALARESEQKAAIPAPASIGRFASKINAHVIVPGAPHYESARLDFNCAFDRHPALSYFAG
jgi:hypothetical protein